MEKTIFKFLLVILTCLVFQACKKKGNKVSENPLLQPEPEPQMIYGVFNVYDNYVSRDNTFILGGSYAYAVISDSAIKMDDFVETNGWDFGDISCNDIMLVKNYSYNGKRYYCVYGTNTSTLIKKPCSWNISGKDNFLPFSFMDYSSFPTYKKNDEIQDTFYLNTPCSIQLKNYGGTNQIDISISSRCFNAYKTIIPPNTTITFTKDEMSSFNLNECENDGTIFITFSKKSFIKVNDKFYQINSNAVYGKSIIVLKPL